MVATRYPVWNCPAFYTFASSFVAEPRTSVLPSFILQIAIASVVHDAAGATPEVQKAGA